VADVALGDGHYLRSFSLPPLALPSTYLWPREFPSQANWHLWDKFLLQSVCSGHHLLRQTLGPWLCTPHLLTSWGYLDVSSSTLFIPTGKLFQVFHQQPFMPSCHLAMPYNFLETVFTLLASACFIAIVSLAPNGVVSSGYALGPTSMRALSPWTKVQSMLGDSAWPLPLQTPPWWLWVTLQSGLALAVCNGSYQPSCSDNTAASAWLISDSRNLGYHCHSVCAVSGPPDSINLYRAKLQGMHALLLYLNSVCQLFEISSGQMLVACDNSTVISLCNYHSFSPLPIPHIWI